MQAGANITKIGFDITVVAADHAVDAKVERLRLVHLKQFAHQGHKTGFRLALDGCFHGWMRWVCGGRSGCGKCSKHNSMTANAVHRDQHYQ